MKAEQPFGHLTRTAATLTASAALALMLATTGQAAATPEQKCQASKNVAAGRYALCRLKAEKKLTLTNDATKYNAALVVCMTSLTKSWEKAEDVAAKKGATCSDVAFPVGQFALAIDGLADHVSAALGGAAAPAVCDNSCSGKADGTTCDAALDHGTTLICVNGACQACVPNGNGIGTQFVDNGDGTITDVHTCLVWEKKDDSGGPHDKDNEYTWSNRANPQGDCTVAGCPPNGEAFTVFLASLNSSRFAGHGDWRLPSSGGNAMYPTGQPAHRESLIQGTYPSCGDTTVDPVIPCIDPLFNVNCGEFHPPGAQTAGNPGCTVDGAGGTQQCSCVINYYAWSFTDSGAAVVDGYQAVWTVWETLGGQTPSFKKTFPHLVRAVRGGVVFVP